MNGHFVPADEREHERGNRGYQVPDYCANCGRPFMLHYNGSCPADCTNCEGGGCSSCLPDQE